MTQFIDKIIVEVDTALKTLLPANPRITARVSPAKDLPETKLSRSEQKHCASLMRVNHTGEVCAQALYQGQGATARLAHVRQQMQDAALEETDHLAWCEQRLRELDDKTSLLNPFWYASSFLIGAIAGLAGDQYSLGFLAETEKQVYQHLQNHLNQIHPSDHKTRLILQQMQADEGEHAKLAQNSGGVSLPGFIKSLMRLSSKLMTRTSYYI